MSSTIDCIRSGDFRKADIAPSRYVPPWWALYPPDERSLLWLYNLGYNDALEFIKREGLVPENELVFSAEAELAASRPSRKGFGRFFGYRSVLRIVPSTLITVVACVFFVLLVRPISIILVRLELFARAVALMLCRGKWMESCACASLACGKWKEDMAKQSVMFRVVTHYV